MPEENWIAHGGVPACDLCHARKVDCPVASRVKAITGRISTMTYRKVDTMPRSNAIAKSHAQIASQPKPNVSATATSVRHAQKSARMYLEFLLY